MCALAHAFEREGLATVVLSLVRAQSEASRAPRVLHCEFPLGRPLGKPGDPAFQHRVLEAALGLLVAEPPGPVFVEFGEEIHDEAEQPLSCPLPPFHDPNAHPVVNEARGLRAAYNRTLSATGRSALHRVIGPDDVPGVLAELVRMLDGGQVDNAGLPGSLADVMLDVRAYYEEAGFALADHVPAARQLESWLYQSTEAGKVMLGIRKLLESSGAPPMDYMFLAPITQVRP